MRYEEELERDRKTVRQSTIVGPDWSRIRYSALICAFLTIGALYCGSNGQNILELVLTFLAGACGAYSVLHLENKRLYVEKPPMAGQ